MPERWLSDVIIPSRDEMDQNGSEDEMSLSTYLYISAIVMIITAAENSVIVAAAKF